MKKPKVVVIGLDGADPKVMKRLMSEGRLPTLSKIARTFISTKLSTTVPAHSGPAWASFSTGAKPGKTGIFSFLTPAGGYNQRHAVSHDLKLPTFWEIAEKYGFRSGVINIPLTYPPRPVDGFIVSGLPAHEDASFPQDFHLAAFKDMTFGLDALRSAENWTPYLRNTLRRDLTRASALPALMADHDIDLLVAVFDILDRSQHRYWYSMDSGHPSHNAEEDAGIRDIIPRCYEVADTIVKFLIDEIGDAVFIILSDHGFRPTKQKFNLTRLLASKGLIRLAGADEISRRYENGARKANDMLDLSRSLLYLANEDLITAIGINVNVKGRDPNGIVLTSKRIEIAEKTIEVLLDARDPESGEQIFESAHLKEELFFGPQLAKAPDIMAISDRRLVTIPTFKGLVDNVLPALPDKDFAVDNLNANHSGYGIFMACGPDVRPAVEWNRVALMSDVAPTILSVFGIPPAKDMDGLVLPILLEEPQLVKLPSADSETEVTDKGVDLEQPDEIESRALEDRLRGMGYL